MAVVAAYTTAWMRLSWRPEQPLVLAAGMFAGALVYGGIGIVLAAVLRSELAGMFLAIMINSIDLVLQNPLVNPDADSAVVRFLPAYGAVQTSVAASGLQVVPANCLLLGAGWAVGVAAVGMAAFAARTRAHHPRTPGQRRQALSRPRRCRDRPGADVVADDERRARRQHQVRGGVFEVPEQNTAASAASPAATAAALPGPARPATPDVVPRGEARGAWLLSDGGEPRNWMLVLAPLVG